MRSLTARWTVFVVAVALVLSGTGPAAASASRPHDLTCLVGYCITSADPMGDGAIVCADGQLTEVLEVHATVGVDIPYSFPYVTAEADTPDGQHASGFASVDESGEGPTGLDFTVRMGVPGPGDYSGLLTGEGAGIAATFAPDFAFSFTVGGQSPVSKAAGDPSCAPDPQSLAHLIGVAALGAVLTAGVGGAVAKEIGETAETVHQLLELEDKLESVENLLKAIWALMDPPDPNYTTPVVLAPVDCPGPLVGLTYAHQAALTAEVAAFCQAIGAERAFVTAYERAWGADEAHDAGAYQMQLASAAGFAAQAAQVLATLPALMAAVQQALAPQPLGIALTADEITSYQRSVMAGTRDPELASGLTALGASPAEVESMFLGAASVDASSMVGEDVSAVFSEGAADYGTEAAQLSGFAAWATTVATPAVSTIYPDAGPVGGGMSVTLTGRNLADVSEIDFGTTPSPQFSCAATACDAVVPSTQQAGPVHLTVIGGGGPSVASSWDVFTYGGTPTPSPEVTAVIPRYGPKGGGNTVTITGTDLAQATSIAFGEVQATILHCASTSCTVTAPAGSDDVTVVATTPSGISEAVAGTFYRYTAPDVLPAPAHNLVPGGTFEAEDGFPIVDDFTTYGVGSFGPWTITQGGVDLAGVVSQAAQGLQSIDLNGEDINGIPTGAAILQQAIPTQVGHVYTVSYGLAANTHGLPVVKHLLVSFGGLEQAASASNAGRTDDDAGWRLVTFSTTACTTSTLLRFQSLTPDDRGPLIDRVAVVDTGKKAACAPSHPAPSVTAMGGGRLAITRVSTAGVLQVRTATKGQWLTLRNGVTGEAVASAQPGLLTVAATDSAGRVWLRSRNSHGKWSRWTRLSAPAASSVSLNALGDGDLALAVVTSRGVLELRTLAKGRWSSWVTLRRGVGSAALASASAGAVTVAATDASGRVWLRTRSAAGKWKAWSRLPSPTARSVALAGIGGDRLALAMVTPQGVLRLRTLAKGRWSGWTTLRTGVVGASIAAPAGDLLTVVAMDSKGVTWQRSRNSHARWGMWSRG